MATAFRLIVFDWDGTLLDSIAAIVGCTQTTLAELKLPHAAGDDIRSAIGLGLRETVERICPGCDQATFARIVEVYRRHWFAGYSTRSVLFEGVLPMLDRLTEQGRLLAIATAKGRRGLTEDLDRTGLGGVFHASRTVDESASKPDPGMLLEILDELGVHRTEALMIGDSVHDLGMAANAAVAALGVASGTTPRTALLEAGPLDCLDRVTDLSGWLENHDPR